MTEAFRFHQVLIAPGHDYPYNESEWRDCLVVVKEGSIELIGSNGQGCRLENGAILWLVGLPLRAIVNPGNGTACLLTVSRAGADR